MTQVELPVDEILPDLVAALRDRRSAVLFAPTGAGKTTRVPSALADSGLLEADSKIIMLEPRRVAARAAARRIAKERKTRLGDEVGYQIRFDRRFGPQTRILIVTEGVLIRLLQADPFLTGVSALIFDEFHERSLQIDLALAMARRVQEEARPDLRLVVMSATLDPGPISTWLGDCPVVRSEGRTHPVSIQYLGQTRPHRIAERVADGVRHALAECEGDVLAFLPGVGEIRRTAANLGNIEARVVELYGDLPPERQDAALAPLENRRKVVLATNVAETSLTIPGVRSVVDGGYVRKMHFDPNVGLDRLDLQKISRASADQRAGRAGREAPGTCFRMWPEHLHQSLEAFDRPEIKCVDLCGAILEVLAWGEPSAQEFPWFESPEPEALDRADSLLKDLGAVDVGGVTALGSQMVRWPVHPRLARLLVAAHESGVCHSGAQLAALLAERDPFLKRSTIVDILDRLEIIERALKSGDARLHPGRVRMLERAAAQHVSVAKRVLGSASSSPPDRREALAKAMLAAFPDRVARRRSTDDARGLMTGGRGVVLPSSSALDGEEFFVCVQLDLGSRSERADAPVRQAVAIHKSWISSIERSVETVFDQENGRVMAVERERYRDLILYEGTASAPEPIAAASLLAEHALGDLDRATGLHEGSAARLLARIRSLAGWMPELGLPTFEGASMEALVKEAAQGRRSFTDLRKAPWENLIGNALDWKVRQALDREAPESLEVPSGNRIKLQYEPGQPPILAVRIQEIFGLADTPRIAGGRIPVMLHLLAPNMRPQQVTQDLRSFWDTTYTEVRKDLRRRYPKHAWPEDPWTARAEKRPRRKNRGKKS